MKRLGKIGRMLLLPTLCLTIVLLAGCGQKSAEMNTIEVLHSDLAEDDCLSVTLVNASEVPVGSVIFEWYDNNDQEYRMNALSDDDILEPDSVRQILLPESAVSYECMPCDTEDGCILVIPPSDSDYDTRIIFAPGTEIETAKESVLAAISAAGDEKPEDTLTSEEAEEAVRKLGFDSLTEMRMQEHPDLTVSIDYTVYPEEEPNREIYALYGYWYPDGDQNSLTYFSVSDMGVQWYSFNPEKGDVQTDNQRITGRVLQRYKLSDGRSFTVEGSALEVLDTGWLTFDDDDTKYKHSND